MDSFITKNLTLDTELNALSKAMVSDILTRPLTVIYALSMLNLPIPNPLLIHVVGSNNYEVQTSAEWDILPKFLPIKSLKLKFIGPEIHTAAAIKSKNLAVGSSNLLYHELANSSPQQPDLIVAFNCGLHEFQDTDEDTWRSSLSTIVARRVPIVLTSYTTGEAVMDVARIVAIDERCSVRMLSNPFASLSPMRDVESLGVYYVNSVLSVLVPSP